MNRVHSQWIPITAILVISYMSPGGGVVPAFPGAEGFGAQTPGGRGGRIIKVTNLNASGPGSLHAACQTPGARIVIFAVSGIIPGDIVISEPYITIAGQTAPGAGITIEGMLRSDLRDWNKPLTSRPHVHDVVVRFLRVRSPAGRGDQGDCIQFSSVDNAVCDHLSLSWAEDETIDLWARSTNITIQWCTLEESSLTGELNHTGQGGGGHFYGLISGGRSNRISIHHNLFAHHENRNPCIGSGPVDFRNNVVYNFRAGSVHHNNYTGTPGFNFIGNYYKSGPSTVSFHPNDPHIYPWCFEGKIPYYLRDNFIAGIGLIQDPWAEAYKMPAWARHYGRRGTKQQAETPVPAIRTHSPLEAYRRVLAGAGCFPRDVVTRRTIDQVKNGTGSWGRHEPDDLLEGLIPHKPAKDSDNDGMPDNWERSRGLDAKTDDSTREMPSGYTAIEDYLNELAALQISGTGSAAVIRVLADKRLAEPLGAIAAEYGRRTGSRIGLDFVAASEVGALMEKKEAGYDAVLCMPVDVEKSTTVEALPGAKKVAWKYPSGKPVWAAVLTAHPDSAGFIGFAGGPTGHRLWSESKAGFTITSGRTHAEAFEWVVENRVKHTYPMTAMRMLAECGGITEGICVDIGCGTGNLDIALAKRSDLNIIGLDIDPDMKPLFERRVRRAGLQDRIRFVTGDAQKMPFPDDYADIIVSRGTLIFIDDIAECLRQVDRVLKPTGVAFLGGRYLYTPQAHKISDDQLKTIVRKSGVSGAAVIEHRGQWVKIIGPEAPQAAHRFQGGPGMLAGRIIVDYGITEGTCLVICPNDSGGSQALQNGLLEMTNLNVVALYPSDKIASAAEKRIRLAGLSSRITCKTGTVDTPPFDQASFDLIVGAGPVLIWGDRQKKMRQVYRVLRPGGAALIGGRYLGMPDFRKVSSETLRADAAATQIASIRILDDMGQWVEILKPTRDRDPGN